MIFGSYRLSAKFFSGRTIFHAKKTGGVYVKDLPNKNELMQWQQDLNRGLTVLRNGGEWSIETTADSVLRVETGGLVSQNNSEEDARDLFV